MNHGDCVVGTAKQLWQNQTEEDGPRGGRGIQDFAEARASGNVVGQKAGSPSFCLMCGCGLVGKSIFAVKASGYFAPSKYQPSGGD